MRPVLIGLVLPLLATAPFGWYFPLHDGMSWTYVNVDDPFDEVVFAVLDAVSYEGHDAYLYGRWDDYNVIAVEGGVVRVLAETEEGVLYDFAEDVVLDQVIDGATFRVCPDGGACDSTLVRIWTELDPALRSLYELDDGPQDLVLLVSYDRNHPPNLHNLIVESDLPPGAVPPMGAVTFLEWYLRGVGRIDEREVLAASGGVESHYVLTSTTDAAAPPPLVLDTCPNPFNPRTELRFTLPAPAAVTLAVYDAAGRRVRTLLTGAALHAGAQSAAWDGADDRGRALPSGTYVARLDAADASASLRLTLLR